MAEMVLLSWEAIDALAQVMATTIWTERSRRVAAEPGPFAETSTSKTETFSISAKKSAMSCFVSLVTLVASNSNETWYGAVLAEPVCLQKKGADDGQLDDSAQAWEL
jgi:hypothetical protein